MSAAWTRRLAAAAGSPGRVAPDDDDAVVFLDCRGIATGSVPNAGSGGSGADLTAMGGLLILPGQFGEGAPGCTSQNGGGTLGGTLAGGVTTIGEAAAITISGWVMLLAGTSFPGIMPLFGKASEASSFGFVHYLGVYQDRTPEVALSAGGDYAVVHPGAALSLFTWHHLVATYNGTALKLYVDGVLAGSATAAGSGTIGWANHGGYFAGGWSHNGGNFSTAPGAIADLRAATLVRPASWAETVWASRRRAA